MSRVGILLAVVVSLFGIAWHFGGPRGPSLADVEHLLDPRVYSKEPKTLLVARHSAQTAAEVAKKAFAVVFPAYFKLFGSPASSPSGRWWNNEDGSITGEVGLELPSAAAETANHLPEGTLIVTWEYGSLVAEILHVGSYATETPTINKLREFANAQGLMFTSDHEEEYLRGPGFLFSGNPDTYLTLIRYPVVPKAA